MTRKITILSHNLSDNSFGRAYLLAMVLKRRYQVEIAGPCFGKGIWAPCSDLQGIECKTVEGHLYPGFLSNVNKLTKMITGDVIYAIKNRPSSFGVGILKHLSSKKPLVLDIDDWEVGFYLRTKGLRFIEKCLNFRNPNSLPYCYMLEKMTGFADQITTVSHFLQKRFGGVIIPHGKDTRVFDPQRYDRKESRKKVGQDNGSKIIMFLGTPRRHKGLEDVIQAIERIGSIRHKDLLFMIVGGNINGAYEKQLMEMGKEKVKISGMIPFDEIPLYLSAADIMVIPQRFTPDTVGQVPAKVFDAMAMAKPVVSTKVSMLPDILNGCGLLVEPGDITQISEALDYLLSNPSEAHDMGMRARQRCIERYSWDRMEHDLIKIFDKY